MRPLFLKRWPMHLNLPLPMQRQLPSPMRRQVLLCSHLPRNRPTRLAIRLQLQGTTAVAMSAVQLQETTAGVMSVVEATVTLVAMPLEGKMQELQVACCEHMHGDELDTRLFVRQQQLNDRGLLR